MLLLASDADLSGFVAVVVSLVAAGIAWRQYKTAHDQLRLALFDKRFELYTTVAAFIQKLNSTWSGYAVTHQDVTDFLVDTNHMGFLVGKQLCDYIDSVKEKGTEKREALEWLADHQHLHGSPEHRRRYKVQEAVTEWAGKQRPVLLRQFLPYLDFSKVEANDDLPGAP